MTRFVTVLSDDRLLLERARAALSDDVRFIVSSDGLHCDGLVAPLTNLYTVDNSPDDWEGWGPDRGLADPATMTTLLLECRSPRWIAEVGVLLADASTTQVWIVDSADVVWPAAEVDPERIAID